MPSGHSRTTGSGSNQGDEAGRAGCYLADHHAIVDRAGMLRGARHQQPARGLRVRELQAILLGPPDEQATDEVEVAL